MWGFSFCVHLYSVQFLSALNMQLVPCLLKIKLHLQNGDETWKWESKHASRLFPALALESLNVFKGRLAVTSSNWTGIKLILWFLFFFSPMFTLWIVNRKYSCSVSPCLHTFLTCFSCFMLFDFAYQFRCLFHIIPAKQLPWQHPADSNTVPQNTTVLWHILMKPFFKNFIRHYSINTWHYIFLCLANGFDYFSVYLIHSWINSSFNKLFITCTISI